MWYAHDPAAYEAEEWSRPDEMALFQCLWSYTRCELDARPNSHLLDLCCGTGMSLLGVVSHPHLSLAVGVDLSFRLLDFAKRRYAPFGNVRFVRADAAQRIFRPGSFDIVIASSAYHHIEPHRKNIFVAACHEVLKPEGRLIVAENLLPPFGGGSPRVPGCSPQPANTENAKAPLEAKPPQGRPPVGQTD